MPENIWRVFEDTGDPLCYLIYKAENNSMNKNQAANNIKEISVKANSNTPIANSFSSSGFTSE